MIVFDLDDTLRTTKQSHDFIPSDPSRTENWLAWQEHVVNNGKPIFPVHLLYKSCTYHEYTVILTSSQFGTAQWLEMNELPLPDEIMERHPNDHSTPFEFKKRFIDENHRNISLWIDDHRDVCDYAESRNIKVIRV